MLTAPSPQREPKPAIFSCRVVGSFFAFLVKLSIEKKSGLVGVTKHSGFYFYMAVNQNSEKRTDDPTIETPRYK